MRSEFLIEAEQLVTMLDQDDLRLFEVGFVLPGLTDGAGDFHNNPVIPKARFFDIDRIADPNNPLPHMVPGEADFTRMMRALGINNDSLVVMYDRQGLFSAGRGWWLMRLFGHRRVKVLNGGMRYWLACGFPTQTGVARESERPPEEGNFTAKPDTSMVVSIDQLKTAIAGQNATVVDARPAERFHAQTPEPREGVRAGHMPGAHNLPFASLTDPETGKLRQDADLQQLFAAIPIEQRVYSCGSGVTACALMMAAHIIGQQGGAVYDGSWVEWGSRTDTRVVSDGG